MTPGCLVLGTGRCGSTLLSNILRAHADVLSLSEWFTVLGGPRALEGDELGELDGQRLWLRLSRLDPDLNAILSAAPVAEILLPIERDAQGEAAAGALAARAPLELVPLPHLGEGSHELLDAIRVQLQGWPAAAPGEQFTRLFEWLALRLGKSSWVERSGGSIEYREQLVRHLPAARELHLLREGPACALSMSQHSFFRVRLARILRKAPELDVARCLVEPIPLDRFGAYWSALMMRTQQALRAAPAGKCLLVRYERLLDEPEPQLRRIAQFLDVACPEPWLMAARAALRPARDALAELPAPERAALERACRPGLRVLRALSERSAA